MGQKIHPIGFRLGVQRIWTAKWYGSNRNFSSTLLEDIKVRDYLKKKLAHASVSKVLIERPAKNARITIFSGRPGVVIGKKGEDIEVLRGELARLMSVPVHVNIEEVRKPETDAEIARTEWYREGRVPLHTLRAVIDFGFAEAKTTYGIIGIKVCVYKGDALN